MAIDPLHDQDPTSLRLVGGGDPAPKATSRSPLRRAALHTLALVVAVEALLVYRFWSQLTAAVPEQPPWTWLYALSGRFVDPFRRFELVTPVRDGAILEYSLLLAMETYLVAGFLMAVLCWWASHVSGWAALPAFLNAAILRHSGIALRLASARGATAGRSALALAGQALQSGLVYLRTRDWERYRARAVLWYQAADAAAEKVWRRAAAAGRAAQVRAGNALAQASDRVKPAAARLHEEWARFRAEQWPPLRAGAVSAGVRAREAGYSAASRYRAGCAAELTRAKSYAESRWQEYRPALERRRIETARWLDRTYEQTVCALALAGLRASVRARRIVYSLGRAGSVSLNLSADAPRLTRREFFQRIRVS